MNKVIDVLKFNDRQRDAIVSELRSKSIPHLVDSGGITVDESNYDIAIALVRQITDTSTDQDRRVSTDEILTTREREFQDRMRLINQAFESQRTTTDTSDGGSFVFSLIGLLAGIGLGAAIVISALSDPNFEGSVPIFLPSIILGIAGFFLGAKIDSGIDKRR